MAFVTTVSLLSVLILLHIVVNSWLLRRPAGGPSTVDNVAVLLPLRDEAHRVEPCLRALLALDGGPEIVVLDDGSTDGTADLVRAVGGDRVRLLLAADALPEGWLGKPYACQRLAEATGDEIDVLAFVDADVVLAPHAVTASAGLLDGFDLVSPYPRILAEGRRQRIAQPLLQWSWLAFLPLRAMERSRRPSLAAAGGQFLVVRRDAYFRAGGHAAVRDRVLEDIELARAVKRSGGRIALADGSRLASCRMYTTWPELVDGYTKSLWASFGSPVGAAAVLALLGLLFVVPPFGWLFGPTAGLIGLAGYAAGVAGRAVAARATGGRAWPDALAHPASVLLFGWLVVRSFRRRGAIRWKGRRVRI